MVQLPPVIIQLLEYSCRSSHLSQSVRYDVFTDDGFRHSEHFIIIVPQPEAIEHDPFHGDLFTVELLSSSKAFVEPISFVIGHTFSSRINNSDSSWTLVNYNYKA